MTLAKRERRRREVLTAVGFLLPNCIGFLAFTFLPVLASLALAFSHWNILTPPRFAGLDNFRLLLGFHQGAEGWAANDPLVWKYLYNTIYLMLAIPFGMLASLLLAMALNRGIKGSSVFRTIYFIPCICPGVAVTLLWKWMYSKDDGLINSYLCWLSEHLHLGGGAVGWLTDPATAKISLMLMALWAGIGGCNALLYLAALQNVPRQLYEAAEIDGAGPVRRFLAVTWPMISPTTFFIAITSLIGGFQGGFMTAYMMTGGGPDGATTTLDYYIYQTGFTFLRMGYASAIAWLMFILVLLVTIIGWKYGGRRVVYN